MINDTALFSCTACGPPLRPTNPQSASTTHSLPSALVCNSLLSTFYHCHQHSPPAPSVISTAFHRPPRARSDLINGVSLATNPFRSKHHSFSAIPYTACSTANRTEQCTAQPLTWTITALTSTDRLCAALALTRAASRRRQQTHSRQQHQPRMYPLYHTHHAMLSIDFILQTPSLHSNIRTSTSSTQTAATMLVYRSLHRQLR